MCSKWVQGISKLKPAESSRTHTRTVLLWSAQPSPSGPVVPKVCCSSDTRKQQLHPLAPWQRKDPTPETWAWTIATRISAPEHFAIQTLFSAYQHSQHPWNPWSRLCLQENRPYDFKKPASKQLSVNGGLQQYHHRVSSSWTVITEISHHNHRAERQESSIKQEQQGSSHRRSTVRRHFVFMRAIIDFLLLDMYLKLSFAPSFSVSFLLFESTEKSSILWPQYHFMGISVIRNSA